MIQGYTAPNADETVIKTRRLKELEAKEKAHDQYLRATVRMRGKLAGEHWTADPEYSRAMRDFAELIVEEGWKD